MKINRPDFRVIADGDDAVGFDLTLVEAVALLEDSRERGMRHVAIINDTTVDPVGCDASGNASCRPVRAAVRRRFGGHGQLPH